LLGRGGTVLAASDVYLRAVGSTREQVLGRSVFDLPPYATAPRSVERLRHALATLGSSNVVTPHDLPDATPCRRR